VEVPLGSHATLNIVLKIALQRSTIQVTEQAPLIRAESGDVTATINRQEIDELPNPGNDRTYIVQTAPGMVMNTDYGVGNFSNLGMPGTSNLFTVNGMTFNDFGVNVNASGALGLTLGTNEVEEAAVVSNGYSGQFGGAAGANVTYITRSGGNQYHGNAKYYWNGRILNANDWFNNATGTPRQPDNVSEWAASLGGPIKKDKLFFFLNTEGAIVLIPSPPSQVVLPSPQFAAATIKNIDAIFGPSSASDAFYSRMFNLYAVAPGASRALLGDPTGGPGCGSFQWPDPSMMGTPCAVHFSTSISRPSDQALVSGRIDWNSNRGDRAFLVVQYEHGNQASYTDTISPCSMQIPGYPLGRASLSRLTFLVHAPQTSFLSVPGGKAELPSRQIFLRAWPPSPQPLPGMTPRFPSPVLGGRTTPSRAGEMRHTFRFPTTLRSPSAITSWHSARRTWVPTYRFSGIPRMSLEMCLPDL
jgi:hypothetical protein